MLALKAHLAESINRALEGGTGQEAGSKSCGCLLFCGCRCRFRRIRRGWNFGRGGNGGRSNGGNRFRHGGWWCWFSGRSGNRRRRRLGLVYA